MSCLREVQTISQSPHILPMPSLTRLTTGGVLNPLKNTTNTSHNELLHQDPLQPPLEPRRQSCEITRPSREHTAAGASHESTPYAAIRGFVSSPAGISRYFPRRYPRQPTLLGVCAYPPRPRPIPRTISHPDGRPQPRRSANYGRFAKYSSKCESPDTIISSSALIRVDASAYSKRCFG